jgi:hypothetical protein
MIIKWINKFSREEGYVQSVSTKEKHFVNTFDRSEAKIYKTMGAAKTAVKSLISYGEGENNEFEIIPV